jgi:hypothetical protein
MPFLLAVINKYSHYSSKMKWNIVTGRETVIYCMPYMKTKTSGLNCKSVTKGWWNWDHNAVSHFLSYIKTDGICSSDKTVSNDRAVLTWHQQWCSCVVGEQEIHILLVGKPLLNLNHRWEDNIKMDIHTFSIFWGCDMECRNTGWWHTSVNMLIFRMCNKEFLLLSNNYDGHTIA